MAKKLQYCCYCGKELGVYDAPPFNLDTCGAKECERFAAEMDAQDRAEAHEKLDRERGWK